MKTSMQAAILLIRGFKSGMVMHEITRLINKMRGAVIIFDKEETESFLWIGITIMK